MSDIVKYHNDMNSVNFNRFNAVELDLLLSICSKIRDEGLKTVTYSFNELKELSKYSATSNTTFIKDLRSTYRKLIQLTFCVGSETEFTEFVLFTKYKVSAKKQDVTIAVNEEFSYILNELTSNFTRFELDEFVLLQSKYAKNTYRLLKQFRSTGQVFLTLEEFKIKLDIPKSYAMRDINKKVLTPIQEELTPLFENLTIEKIKNTSKRGHPITHINFSFKPHKRKTAQQKEIDKEYLKQLKNIYLPDFTIEEIQTLRQYATDEDLKIVSKQYQGYKQQAKIKNKMGFMVQTLKNWNNMKNRN